MSEAAWTGALDLLGAMIWAAISAHYFATRRPRWGAAQAAVAASMAIGSAIYAAMAFQ